MSVGLLPSNQAIQGGNLDQIRVSELKMIKSSVYSIRVQYIASFNSEIDVRMIPIMKLYYDKTSLGENFKTFWANSKVFDSINPVWDAYITKSGFQRITSMQFTDDIIFAIQDFLKGRFIIVGKTSRYIEVRPKLVKPLQLFGLIIVESYPEMCAKILICSYDESSKSSSIESTFKEIRLSGVSICDLDDFGENPVRSILNSRNEGYIPSPNLYETLEELLKQGIRPHSIRVSQGLEMNLKSEPIAEVPANMNLSNFLKFSRADMPPELVALSQNVERFRTTYLKKTAQDLRSCPDWIELLVNYHYQDSLILAEIDFYQGLGVEWSIVSFNYFFHTLMSLGEQQFLHYLYKIVKFSQGHLIENIEYFLNINKEKKKFYLVIPLMMEEFQLRPVLAVLFFDTRFEQIQKMPRLGILGWWDLTTMKNTLEEFQNTFKCISDIKTCFQRDSIKSLVIFDGNFRILPLKSLSKENKIDMVSVYFCTIPPGANKDSKFIIFNSRTEKEITNAEIKKIETGKHLKLMILSHFVINKNSDFRIKSGITSFFGSLRSGTFERVNGRNSGSRPALFLFDVDFNSIDSGRSDIVPISVFKQLTEYCEFILEVKNYDLIYDLCNSFICAKLENTQENDQVYLEFLESSFQKFNNDNLESFCQMLSLVSLSKSFPFEYYLTKTKEFVEFFINYPGNIIGEIKAKPAYKFIFKGLTKVLICATLYQLDGLKILERVKDFIILKSIIEDFIKAHIKAKKFIETQSIQLFFGFINSLPQSQRDRLTDSFLHIIPDLAHATYIMLQPACAERSLESKKDFFSNLMSTLTLDNYKLMNFLDYFITNFSSCQPMFDQSKLVWFFQSHFEKISNCQAVDIPYILQIINSMSCNQFFKDFKQDPVIINVMQASSSFTAAIDLIQSLRLDPTYYFILWIDSDQSTNMTSYYRHSQSYSKIIAKVDQELIKLPESLQILLAPCLFTVIDESFYMRFVEIFTQAKCIHLKSCYLKNFREIIFKDSRLRNDFMRRYNSGNFKNNEMMKEVYIYAIFGCTTSDEELYSKIVVNPSENDGLYAFFADISNSQNNESYNIIKKYILQYCSLIKTEQIKFKDLRFIHKQSTDQRKAFKSFIQIALNDSKENGIFLQILEKCLNKFLHFYEDLKIVKDFLFKYCNNSRDFDSINKSFNEFHSIIWNQILQDLRLPESFLNFVNLLRSRHFPINSAVFLSFASKLSSLQDIENLHSSLEKMTDCLVLLGTNQGISTKRLSQHMISIYSERQIDKETSILSIYFQSQDWFITLFPQVLSNFRKFNTFHQLLLSLQSVGEYLNLSLSIKEKISSIPHYLSPDFLELIHFFSNQGLAGRSLEDIDSLKSFFSSLSEFQRTLILAGSLQEDEISFWQECFQESIENKNLTLNLIQKFSNIWSFLHLIKRPGLDLPNLFQLILESLINPRYQSFLEDLALCDKLTHVLEEYNKSLNNQEQVKLTKIKSIVLKSKYRISYQRTSYEVILFMSKENDDFDSNFLSLHELEELRDRALLSKYIIDQKANNQDIVQDIEIYENFVKFVDKLSEFMNIINRLSQSLYRDDLRVEGEFFLHRGDLTDLMQYHEYYKYLLEVKWKVSFREISKKNYWINFLNGERILLIDRFVFTQTNQNLTRILPILRYMQKNHPDLDPNPRKPPEEMTERLQMIENELSSYSKIDFQLKLNLPGLEVKPKPVGQLLIIESKEYYKAILSIYAIFENSVPTVDLVFFCYLTTSWQELKIFINRFFLNENHQIFTLVFPENLSLETQMKLESKIIKNFQLFIEKCLALVTNNPRSKIVNNLRYQKEIHVEKFSSYSMLKDQQVTEIIRKLAADIEVVSSKYSGLGKSAYIQGKSQEAGRTVIEIDLSGTYESCELGCNLEAMTSPLNSSYHIQISFLAQPEFFEHLIFSLSVFKQHYSHNSLFVLPDDSGLFIEVANTFKNRLLESLPFLRLLPNQKYLKRLNLKSLKISENLIYVSSYLELYDNHEIDKVDLSYVEASQRRQNFENSDIRRILSRHFFEERVNESNFHQLSTFIKILTTLLKNFEKSMFSTVLLKFQMQDFEGTQAVKIFKNIRSSMVQSMIETTKEFTTKCTDNVLLGQNAALKKAEDSKEEVQNLADCSIKWENSNHFISLFLADGDFLCIYREAELIPMNIRKMIIAQQFVENCINRGRVPNIERVVKQYMSGTGNIKEYSSFTSEQLIENLVTFYIKNSLRKQREQRYQAIITGQKELDLETMKTQRVKQLAKSGYILTPDNFLKMNLIYLRCISSLPLIIMGETGCGKTSLLRFFVEEILQEKLEIIYIHSGITVDHIREKLIEANNLAQKALADRVWVFFDEFNTSDLIGVIVNVLCERKFENLNLSPKLICVGACNPYRVKSVVTYQENVGIKKKLGNSQSQLVHVVKPLPDKAIEFVWDFGALKHQEIRQYLKSMLSRVIENGLDMFVELICAAHEYFQTSEDLSSVSLRDVNRFIRLNKWFIESIKTRNHFRKDVNDIQYNLLRDAVHELEYLESVKGTLLAFFHCYYLRISSAEQREQFLDVVMSVISNHLPTLQKHQMQMLIQFEQLNFIHRMIIPEGIALNQALTENIFAILPCLMNQIPVFICGKPGCSKSLAIQIISSSIRGDKSIDSYLKTLPELQIVSFQGSDSCTSEGVEEVFNKAEKLLNYSKHILPVVLFDEIGLAEVSRYNPLKVLHKLLEAENCKVGFIAISNWRLDASKMNRALYLARPDPGQDELVNTATILFDSLGIQLEEGRVKRLADGYFEIKQIYSSSPYPDFYGLRDFYHMIKHVGKEMFSGRSLDESVQISLQRNFNGLEHSKELIQEVYQDFFNQKNKLVPVVELIRANLLDRDSRYLMIICARDVSIYLQSTLIQHLLPNSRLIIGSTLEKDVLQENTRFRVLSDIIGYMEQGIPIVLQDMDIIYSSLYDLFNQNFTKLGNLRRYCRIALGAQFNPKCFVNDLFKAVVFLDNDQNTLQSADAPFLNRFEKHFVVLKEILSDDCLQLSESIKSWIQKILKISLKDNRLEQVAVFPCYSDETVNLFIKLNEEKPDLYARCIRFWIQNASMDVLLLCKMNVMEPDEKLELANTWKKLHSRTFIQYLEKFKPGKQVKMISATYDPSSIDYLKYDREHMLQIEKCCNFKSEEDLKKNFGSFINGSKTVYLFELDYSKEQQHLRFVVNLFERVFKESEGRATEFSKNIVILIRMGRNDENRLPLCLFQGWRYKMFEDLKLSPLELAEEILQLDTKTIVANERIFKFEENIGEITQQAIETLNYTSSVYSYDFLVDYKNAIQQSLTENQNIVQVLKQKILVSIEKFLNRSREKWDMALFTSEKIIHQALSIKDALRLYVYQKFLREFTSLIVLCEKKSALSQIISIKNNEFFLYYWVSSINKLAADNLQVQLCLKVIT